MAIRIDLAKCDGIGVCEMLGSHLFEVGDDGKSHVLTDNPTTHDLDAAREALTNCPRGAISIDGSS